MSSQLPNILVNKVSDESQEISLISDVLEPNASSNTSCRFVIPPKGSILDSQSSFSWKCGWGSYDASAVATECVVFKDFSGSLNSIKRCRLFVGQKLIMSQEHAGSKMFIHNRGEEADTMCEIHDVRFSAMNDFFLQQNTDSDRDFDSGQISLGRDAPYNFATTNRRFTRKIGSGKDAFETQVFLDELFHGLKDLSLPLSKMKEAVSIEIDFETDFSKVFYDASRSANRIATNRQDVVITEPRIFCDYIQYDQATDAALESQINGEGVIVPFRECVVIQRTLNATTSTTATKVDVPLSLNGKAVMKVMVQKLVNVGDTQVLGVGRKEFCGDARSDALPNESYNLLVNDLLIYDQDVDTTSQKYAQLSQVYEKPYYNFPEGMEFKDLSAAYSVNDVLSNSKVVAGHEYDRQKIDGADNEKGKATADGQAGALSFLGISLGKFGNKTGDTLTDAGYRVGSSPMVLRYNRSGGAASTYEGQSVVLRLFVDILRVLDVNAGFTDVRDQ